MPRLSGLFLYNLVMDKGKVFSRHEKKYLITREQLARFLELAGDNLIEDEYSNETICSVYFDTVNDDLIVKSIGKPEFKEKVRVRSYGVPSLEDEVALEVKTKLREGKEKMGYKRRVFIKVCELEKFLLGKGELPKGQISREIEYIFHHLELEPKIYMAYERRSFSGARNKELRVTLDENLRYRVNNLDIKVQNGCKKYFSDDKIILEIKTTLGLPMWLVSILNEVKIFPQRFSKYGMIYQQMKGENV